ncbi:MAG: RNA 2',3'-cyclic phosphodiesterase [Clostridiaceae bacterium]|nr:RNA 2',3'-cyclic phosphodiesterase [Clostridiaceae bacterium]
MVKIRIFIAIDFDKSTKSYLQDIKNKLEYYSFKGHFTHEENFHLTLQFIGELQADNIPNLIKSLQECISKHNAFNLSLDKLGGFKKGDSKLMWIGLEHNEKLMRIYEELFLTLKHAKIAFDEKPLKPHITLGRQITLKKEISELINILPIDKLIIPVNTITLMESKQVNGKLKYVSLATFPLNN